MSKSPRKKGTLKRTRRMNSNIPMDETERAELRPESHSKSRRVHSDPDDIDLSGIGTLFSETEPDWSDDVESLFADKFKEQSPSSKLSRSFGFVGLKESNLLKQPKRALTGSRSIGLTSSERERKRATNRSLEYPRVSSRLSPKQSPKTPRRKSASRDRSRSPLK